MTLIAACAGLAACQDGDTANDVDGGVSNEASNLSVPLPAPPIDRATLLTAVARAASATASGTDDSLQQRDLNGSRFELRIRFGCRGPTSDLGDATFGWTFDSTKRTLRVKVSPTISIEEEIVGRVAGDEFESAEGFWIPRPWLLEPVCPAAAAVRAGTAEQASARQTDPAAVQPTAVEDAQETQSPPPAWPKVGIAQFFSESDARTRQRGMRPYEAVRNLRDNEPISSQGYNLVLSGRLRALPGQRVIVCVSRGADDPPDCIVSARIDRVRIERPDTKEILAEWGST